MFDPDLAFPGIRIVRRLISNETGSLCDRCGKWHWRRVAHSSEEHLRPVQPRYTETGYVWAPYIPQHRPPAEITPVVGVPTRYGRKMFRSDFYGMVRVAALTDDSED